MHNQALPSGNPDQLDPGPSLDSGPNTLGPGCPSLPLSRGGGMVGLILPAARSCIPYVTGQGSYHLDFTPCAVLWRVISLT
jgi:hypothetical protein